MNIKEKYNFQSEIKQLLHLMINSLYSNKEIFLRELISNAYDAIDKLKFYLLTNKHPFSDKEINFRIKIYVNKENNTLVVSDNGIGMKKSEVIKNLGIIAQSGAKKFLKKTFNNKINYNNNIIGQFGVGFYSVFMVSNKVKVKTKSIYELSNNGILWQSNGKGTYYVEEILKSKYGTDIELYIKDECKDYLNEDNIINIIKKYSNYINIPIEYKFFDKKSNKFNWKRINSTEVFWSKNKSSISNEEYKNFYRSLTNNSLGFPLTWIHNKVEGEKEYISILYVPDTSPWEIWNREDYKSGIKIYVRKVYIMDDMKKIIPIYLRFIQGIVDFNDLSLNVSREVIQNDTYISKVSVNLTKKILQMLDKLSLNKDKYTCFWKNFGFILKEGVAEDVSNKYIISTLLRFHSTNSKDCNDYISLQEYLDRMSVGQSSIYYITADNFNIAKSSPHLEYYKKQKIEVLLLCDKIDEWMLIYLTEFKDIKFVCISKSNINCNNNTILNNSNKILNVNLKNDISLNFISRVKDVLGDLVKDVKLTNRLEKFPSILTVESNDMSTQMVKLLIAAGKEVPKVKYLFEINSEHLLVKYILNLSDNLKFKEWITFLFYQSYLIENNSLENPVDFINLVNDLMLNLVIK